MRMDAWRRGPGNILGERRNMPSHQHRIKRMKQSAARNRRNVARKSKIKTLSKSVRGAAAAGDAASRLQAATAAIAKAAKAGALHKRAAARRIGRLAKAAAKAAAGK